MNVVLCIYFTYQSSTFQSLQMRNDVWSSLDTHINQLHYVDFLMSRDEYVCKSLFNLYSWHFLSRRVYPTDVYLLLIHLSSFNGPLHFDQFFIFVFVVSFFCNNKQGRWEFLAAKWSRLSTLCFIINFVVKHTTVWKDMHVIINDTDIPSFDTKWNSPWKCTKTYRYLISRVFVFLENIGDCLLANPENQWPF